jgi:hypothetical protein
LTVIRDGFRDVVSGWMFDGDRELDDRIERSAEWAKANGPLLELEEATVRLMIRCQVARAIVNGEFEPFIPAGTNPDDVL